MDRVIGFLTVLAICAAPVSGAAQSRDVDSSVSSSVDRSVDGGRAPEAVSTDTFPPRPVLLDTLLVQVGSRAWTEMPAVARGVDVLSGARLQALPVRTVTDALSWSIGVDVMERSPAQADLALRGGSFEQVLVLVDGVRMSDRQTGHFDLDLAVPLAEIERIEVLRGPATALYGSDAVGGVVNIVTRRADALVDAPSGQPGAPVASVSSGPDIALGPIDARLSAGSFGALDGSVATSLRLGAAAVRFGLEAGQADGHRPGTDQRLLQTRLALDAPLAGRALRADLAFAGRDFGARGFYAPPSAPYDEYEETRTLTASVGWLAGGAAGAANAGASNGAITLEPRLSARRHEDTFLLQRDDPSFYRNHHVSWQLGGELLARAALAPNARLAVGAEAYRDLLESTGLGDRQETRTAIFAEAVLGDPTRAVLQPGLRVDHHSGFGDFVAPSLAAALQATDRVRLRASAGRAFRAPTWTERYYRDPANIADPELGPERAWEVEAGLDLDAGHGVRLGLAGFIRAASGLIDWARPAGAPDDEPWRTRNVDDATFRGLEFEASAPDLLGARWDLALTALDVESESSDGFVSKYALRPLTRTASLSVERALHPNVLVSARLFHARRAGEDGAGVSSDTMSLAPGTCLSSAAQTYTRGDARVSVLLRNARIFVDGFNLTGSKHCDVNAFVAPGRALRVGVEVGVTR